MKVLLLTATLPEVQSFLNHNPLFDFLVGGVGLPSTIFQLTSRLQQQAYDLVIQAGIAGAFIRSGQPLPGQVVLVRQDCFGDLGVFENEQFRTTLQMGFDNDPEWIVNNNPLLAQLPFKQVKGITVNSITDQQTRITQLQDKWDAEIETMEGAGLHFVCDQLNIPYVQLRSISNVVGVRDKKQWHIKEAIVSLNHALETLKTNVDRI